MSTYVRRVRLEEVDVANIVFFARYSSYAHEAMEHLFEGLAGGYVALVGARRICFATVRMDSEFHAPLRYGDEVSIHVTVARLGTKSVTLNYAFVRGDGVRCATFAHTIVSTDMQTLTSCAMPDDVRALLSTNTV